MNGKKAKLLRKLARKQNQYKDGPEYIVGKTVKKRIHSIDATGQPRLREVEKRTIINKSRYFYRRLKASYKNGEFTI